MSTDDLISMSRHGLALLLSPLLAPRLAPLLSITLAVALGACQTYEKRLDAKVLDKDARPAREAAVRDQVPHEARTPGDGVGEGALPLEGGALPDRCGVPSSCPVLFSYDQGTESKVEIFGSFNNWTSGVAMTLNGSVWQASMTLGHGQQVLYKFVLDGTTWIADPKNPKRTSDPDHNSILDVVCPTSCGG